MLRISLVSLALVVCLAGSADAQNYPEGDLNEDYKVDFVDLQALANYWLDVNCVAPDCEADLDGTAGVNMSDFARLARNWFKDYSEIALVINEFMAKNNSDSGIRDEWGDYDDWIEIYNYGSEAINIGGMYLKDDFNEPSMWMVPTNNPTATLIPAGGFLIIWADDETGEGTLHASFKLSASDIDEDVCLFDKDASTLIDAIFNFNAPTPQEQNKSYGRLPDSSDSWQVFDNPTPGKSNGVPPPSIIISEIMYHPYHDSLVYEPENLGEEYIELFNRGTETVNLSGWQFSDGVDFVFPNDVTLDPCEYLVVAADVNVFTAKYPGVNNIVGGWTGRLNNKGEEIELADENGMIIDRVEYADDGDWAVRELGPVHYQHRGWEWSDAHDGDGKSLELINPELSNEYGQNWVASNANDGTPGVTNSVADDDIALLILDVKHSPIIPGPNDLVTVTARIINELSTGITVTLHYRVDASEYLGEDIYPHHDPNDYNDLIMFDDGAHGDGDTGDGVFGVELPTQPDGTIVEFYIEASDVGANSRTWPAPSDMSSIGAGMQQVTNLLYQVDDTYDPNAEWSAGSEPIFYLIMSEMERGRLADIGYEQGGDNDERYSRAQMNGTFISIDSVDMKLRYTVSIRNRGEGTSGIPPNNYRVNFRHDDSWKEITAININSKYTYLQLAGSAIYRMAGLHAADATAVQVRVNGVNLALTDPSRMYGNYVMLEVYDSDWAESHIPDDGNGNLYKASCWPWSADLTYLGTNPADYQAVGYYKQTNEAENDWTDLFDLTNVLDNEPDITYVQQINRVLDAEQWLRWFAVGALIGYNENGLPNGAPDDYRMYRGLIDTRFQLLIHDLDTILHVGADIPSTSRSIFYLTDRTDTDMPTLDRFIKHPVFVQEYYAQLLVLTETIFAPERLNPLLDQLLDGWIPASMLSEMKQKNAERIANVMQQIPLTFSVNSNLPVSNGFYYTTSNVVGLYGTANAIETSSVLVNGQMADWAPLDGTWTISQSIPLNPGINRVIVQTFDEPNGTGSELERGYIDIWYDDGDESTDSGTISSNTTWDAASGPWHVTGDITIPAGVTLTIEPGTTVFFDSGTGITINGRLVAEGTAYERICLTRVPGSGSYWDGMKFNNTLEDNRLAYADHEFGAGQGEAIDIQSSRVTIDNMSWAETNNNAVAYMEHPQVTISNSFIPGISGEPIHGVEMAGDEYLILKGNVFAAGGGNDIVDWDGTGSDKSYFFALNNIFLGGGDDGLDMDATDAYIEGNIFMNFHSSDPGTTTSNAIAGGESYHANTNLPDYTIVRNIFVGNDHGILIKEDGYITVINNVFVDSNDAAIQFCENGRNVSGPGSGAYIDGNIFWKYVRPLKYLIWEPDLDPETSWPADPNVTVNNSIITDENYPGSDNLLGSGNIDADPIFVDEQGDFHLKSMSPAIGTGPCGLDMGAYVPSGAAICGEPDEITYRTDVTLTVGGPGITHYEYSINDPNGPWYGEFSVDTPIELTGLLDGYSYTIYVTGKNAADIWQSDPCYVASRTWTIDTSYSRLVINEILAHTHGAEPDLIELYYDGLPGSWIDLTGMSLTDEPTEPNNFVFNNQTVTSTIMYPGDYMVLYGDLNVNEPNHLGFALSANGEGLYLYDKPANGGGLIDSVVFGLQINDYSIGRVGYGSVWKLTKPTFGSANIAQPLGDPDRLKINEWLANEEVLFDEDFIELYNPCNLPVDLSELYLTDNPVTQPAKQKLGPLSFAPPNGFAVFIADDVNTPGHLDFKLSADGEMIGLFDAELNEIDKVLYGPQTTDVSQGRSPDGADSFAYFWLPTPGLANPVTAEPTVTRLVAAEATAQYYVPTDSTWESTWMEPDFSELGAWQSGKTGLGFGDVWAAGGQQHVAYNDCIRDPGDGTAENVTSWTINNDDNSHTAGPLKDFGTGSEAGMPTVSFSMVNGIRVGSYGDGGDPAQGTDAYEIFFDEQDNKIVDLSGSNLYYGSTGWQQIMEFTDLDSAATYTFVGTSMRSKSYPNRLSLYTISDADSFVWNSSSGVGGSGATAELQAGNNTVTGYVVRWDDIVPGPDGDFTITVEATAGSEDGKAYPCHGFMLQGGAAGTDVSSEMLGVNSTLWARVEFDVAEDPSQYAGLTLRMRYEDGFVAYLNGVEVVRANFTGAPAWDSSADTDRDNNLALEFEDFDISGYILNLQQGTNVLAIHGLNVNPSDANFLILPELVATSEPNDSGHADEFAVLDGLRITEIMYHDPNGSSFDFIELQNVGDVPLDLNGVRFIDGIEFTFPAMPLLGPGDYVVVVSHLPSFVSRYGMGINVAGEYIGNLSNGGEDIVLQLPWPYEAAILRFEYDDSWYPSTDGFGDSLTIRDPYAHPATWDEAESWQAALPSPE